MRFSRTLVSIALALTIALGGPTGAFAVPSTPPTSPPAEASPDATMGACITIEQALDIILEAVPDAEVKDVSKEPPFTILFSSPTRPTDLLMEFDMNGCVVSANEVAKVNA
jgi:hypothetical protein